MYSMKDTCKKTGLTYETLKFYYDQGLVPHVRQDASNRRLFDDQDIAWSKQAAVPQKLRHEHPENPGVSGSVPEHKRDDLRKGAEKIRDNIACIDQKQQFFDDVLAGRTSYCSSLFPEGVR